jgi:uncharacterized membrane protein
VLEMRITLEEKMEAVDQIMEQLDTASLQELEDYEDIISNVQDRVLGMVEDLMDDEDILVEAQMLVDALYRE